MDEIVKMCQGISARRLSQRTGMKKSKVNAILHGDRHYVKCERSPLSHVNARVVWMWSEKETELPKARTRVNSKNKNLKKSAREAVEQKIKLSGQHPK
jgi:hypothetical protein